MNKKLERKLKGENQEDELDLHKTITVLIDEKYKIAFFTLLFAFLGLLYSFLSPQIYHADAMIQVEKNSDNFMDTLSQMLPTRASSTETEIQLIKSRLVIGKTVSDLNLDTSIEFNRFPFIGNVLSRYINQERPYLTISKFIPNRNLMGEEFVIKNLGKDHYSLTSSSGVNIKGVVGQNVSTPEIDILISKMSAEKGDSFTVTKKEYLSTINEVSKSITIDDRGKESEILKIGYSGEDPILIRKILQSVSDNYVAQGIERKSEEASKILSFIKEQLIIVSDSLHEAETKLNYYRRDKDSIDLTLEAKSALESLVQLDFQINSLEFEEAVLSKLYTKKHPSYIALLEKLQVLKVKKGILNGKIKQLPLTQQNILKLTRDVQSGQAIYIQLMDKKQELEIKKASVIGNIRIIDNAVTMTEPIKPKKTLVVIVSTLLGAMFSSGVVLIKAALVRGFCSVETLEENGITVLASIPYSECQNKMDNSKIGKKTPVLALENPNDIAIEAIRCLRTSLYFTLLELKSKTIMISGVSPDIGKTFISTNLAVVIAEAGRKTLLIDADMRLGYSHEAFHCNNDIGLSEFLSKDVDYVNVVKKTQVEHLDIISRGAIPSNPSELLLKERFKTLLDWASEHYDVVILDVPPILSVTDSVIIGKYIDISILIAKFGKNTLREVESSMSIYELNKIKIFGSVLNFVSTSSTDYYGHGRYPYN